MSFPRRQRPRGSRSEWFAAVLRCRPPRRYGRTAEEARAGGCLSRRSTGGRTTEGADRSRAQSSAGSWARIASSRRRRESPGSMPSSSPSSRRSADRAQRVSLSTRAVEREHPLLPEPLSKGMLAYERLDLSTQLSMASQRDPGLHAFLDCRKPKFVQSSRLGLEVGLVGEVTERRAPSKVSTHP